MTTPGSGEGGILKQRTVSAGDGEPTPEERRTKRARNITLATGGHLVALGVLLVLGWTGISDLEAASWARLAALMVVVQGLLWIVARRGWDEAISWDPHFLYVPILASGVLFAFYIHMAPVSRYLLLMAWFVALLFGVGRLGFRAVAELAAGMTVLYLGTVAHLVYQGVGLSLAFEAIHAGVFLAVNLYAGAVFERLRSGRREMRELRRRLAQQAVTDPLTGLPNRRYLEEFLEAELARIRRHGGECAVAMVDVDDFKNYNDTLGHPAGDEVLGLLAEVMQEELRLSDVVARFGGEEFGIIMVNTGPEEALEAAERFREKVERREFPREGIQPDGELTVSVGVACCPRDGDDYERLIEVADQALYRAKRSGKNRVAAA